MFPQVAEQNIGANSGTSQKSARKKRKKKAAQKNKNRRLLLKKARETKLRTYSNSMTSWAESFTRAATWQLKHQVAHWKSTAMALEYENKILRDMLRHYANGLPPIMTKETPDILNNEAMSVQSESTVEEQESESDEDETDGGFLLESSSQPEISEEFIEYLVQNHKFRQENLKMKESAQLEEGSDMESGPEKPYEGNEETLKEMYGRDWEKISALEVSLDSQFMCDCDTYKPLYWPNIPLRL